MQRKLLFQLTLQVLFGEVSYSNSLTLYSAKRYERMMKAHGIHETQTSTRNTPITSRPKAQPVSSKKRKIVETSDDGNHVADDDEGVAPVVKPEPASTIIKSEPAAADNGASAMDTKEQIQVLEIKPTDAMIKDEPVIVDHGTTMEATLQTDGTDESTLFHDFLQAEALGPRYSIGQISLHEPLDQHGSSAMASLPRDVNGATMQETILIAD